MNEWLNGEHFHSTIHSYLPTRVNPPLAGEVRVIRVVCARFFDDPNWVLDTRVFGTDLGQVARYQQ